MKDHTPRLMKSIRDILSYQPPEVQEVKLARLCLDEMGDLVTAIDVALKRWLASLPGDATPAQIAERWHVRRRRRDIRSQMQ